METQKQQVQKQKINTNGDSYCETVPCNLLRADCLSREDPAAASRLPEPRDPAAALSTQ